MPPEVDTAAVGTLAGAQGTTQGHLTLLAAALAAQSAGSFDQWYDHPAIGSWAAQLVALIEAIQRQAASGTDAYLARVATQITGKSFAPSGSIDVAGLRQGVSHVEVYGRAADTFRYQKSLGKTDGEAQKAAVQRATVMAQTDVQLASRAQSQKFMVVKRVDGWRRIIHPELSRGGTCGLCIAAADRIYHKGELLPIHDRCECTTMPIINAIDPGYSLNKSDLNALYKQAGGTQAAQLSRVRITVHHNGELGPVLGVEGQAFRSPEDLPNAA